MSEGQNQQNSRSSYAHQNADLRSQNPLYEKAAPVRGSFENNRCEYHAKQLADHGKTESQRRHESIAYYKAMRRGQNDNERIRGSKMVRNGQPKLILKPPLSVGAAVDANRHRQDMAQDRWNAKQVQRDTEQDRQGANEQALSKELYRAARQNMKPHQSRNRQQQR